MPALTSGACSLLYLFPSLAPRLKKAQLLFCSLPPNHWTLMRMLLLLLLLLWPLLCAAASRAAAAV